MDITELNKLSEAVEWVDENYPQSTSEQEYAWEKCSETYLDRLIEGTRKLIAEAREVSK